MNSYFNRDNINTAPNYGLNGSAGIYDELAKLQNTSFQLPPTRTVFTDIADEWSKCSAEEQNFINADEDYVKANVAYQQAFNSFLLELVGKQFSVSPYGRSAEEVLTALQKAKDKYREKSNNAVRDIQKQNDDLKNEIADLRKMLEKKNAGNGGSSNRG